MAILPRPFLLREGIHYIFGWPRLLSDQIPDKWPGGLDEKFWEHSI